MFRRLVAIVIIASIIYFPAGWFAVSRQWLDKDVYFSIAAIVGTIASLTSLLSFVRRPITPDDLDYLGIASLEKATSTAKELKELEGRKSQTKTELEELTRTKEELAALVKKASRLLYLQERRESTERYIASTLSRNAEFADALSKYREYAAQIEELDGEVASHPDAELLYEIMAKADGHARDPLAELIDVVKVLPVIGPLLAVLLRSIRVLSQSFVEVGGVALKVKP